MPLCLVGNYSSLNPYKIKGTESKSSPGCYSSETYPGLHLLCLTVAKLLGSFPRASNFATFSASDWYPFRTSFLLDCRGHIRDSTVSSWQITQRFQFVIDFCLEVNASSQVSRSLKPLEDIFYLCS